MPLAVLLNARAQSAPQHVERLRALAGAAHLEVTRDLDEVGPALERLRAAGADPLAIVGGDGSVTGTLTALIDVWPADSLPRVLLAGGGTINTIAKSLGARGGPEALLARALDAPEPLPETARPLLRVTADGAPPRYCAIAVMGAAVRFLDAYHAGAPGRAAAALTLARTVSSVLVGGRLGRAVFAPFEARLEIDGARRTDRFTALGAGTVRHIGLGFAPFLTAGLSPDRFHCVATRSGGRRLALELPAFAAGVFGPHSCLEHSPARRVHVELAEPLRYTLDGDVFPAAKTLTIEAGPLLRFVTPE